MIFSLRVDIDTIKGLRDGVPSLLKIFSKYGIKASFFCPMGWEGDFFSVLIHRFIRTKKGFLRAGSGISSDHEKKSLLDEHLHLGYSLFFPRRFLKEMEILKQIINDGHELGVHGYVHARWRCPTDRELRKEFLQMVSKYEHSFNTSPVGFASPLFQKNDYILELCDEFKFLYASFLPGDKPFHPKYKGRTLNHLQIPITLDIKMRNDEILPLLYYYSMRGYSQKDMLSKSIMKIEQKMKSSELLTMHIHPKDEGMYLLDTFEKLVCKIIDMDPINKTLKEIAEDCSN
jgi:undecaprenyl phosphate-alpha-L-ara4FN deformylase